MSATIAKKNQTAPARTSGRGAAVFITLGVVLLTLGCGWGISLIVGRDGYALWMATVLGRLAHKRT